VGIPEGFYNLGNQTDKQTHVKRETHDARWIRTHRRRTLIESELPRLVPCG